MLGGGGHARVLIDVLQASHNVEIVGIREATEDDIIQYCRVHLAGYKIPRSVDFVDNLPKTDTGKILKKIIRAPFWKDREVKI